MRMDPSNYWRPEIYYENCDFNEKNIEATVADFKFDSDKVMVCGRGEAAHPCFNPRFSIPTVGIESDLYVIVDHDPSYVQYISRPGNYAISVIVDPSVPKKIIEIGGKIFWFSPDYMKVQIPKITAGKFPRENSGLACIMLASYFEAKHALLSGIKLTDGYSQFLEGKDIVFDKVKNNNTSLYSLDGILCEKISIEDWRRL